MKNNKILMLIICVFMVVSSNACFASKAGNTASLFDKGLAMINDVDMLAESKEFVSLFTSDERLNILIEDIGSKDYKKPKAVFVLNDLDKIIFKNVVGDKVLPAQINEVLMSRVANVFPSQLNAASGPVTLAASAIIAKNDSFIYKELKAPATYIYIFDNGYNFTVTFLPDGENIINATVNVVINDALAKCTTKDAMIDFLENSMNIRGVSVSAATEGK